MTEEQFKKVTDWQELTFPESTAISKVYHLVDEVEELFVDLKDNNPDRRLEFADCFILLMGAAKKDGMDYQDICDAINEKMSINWSREWNKPDDRGVVKHKK